MSSIHQYKQDFFEMSAKKNLFFSNVHKICHSNILHNKTLFLNSKRVYVMHFYFCKHLL